MSDKSLGWSDIMSDHVNKIIILTECVFINCCQWYKVSLNVHYKLGWTCENYRIKLCFKQRGVPWDSSPPCLSFTPKFYAKLLCINISTQVEKSRKIHQDLATNLTTSLAISCCKSCTIIRTCKNLVKARSRYLCKILVGQFARF